MDQRALQFVVLGFAFLLCIVTALPVTPSQNAKTIALYQSANNTDDRLTLKNPVYFNPVGTNDTRVARLQISPSLTYQKMLGFGGALTESSAYVFSQMNSKIQQEILDAYFGPDGINYTVCRTHINSCDFSLSSYSFDNSSGDFKLLNFSIEHNRKWLLPFIKRAFETAGGNIKLFATAWSPPYWMKTNQQMDTSPVIGLIPGEEYFQSWALFFSKFVTAYAQEGVPIWGLTPQNEPRANVDWETCRYTPDYYLLFVRDYWAPQLRKDHPGITLMIHDHNKDDIVQWATKIFSDPIAASLINGTAFHWYSGPEFPNINATHNLFPDKFLLATEATNGPGVIIDDWSRGELYGYDIIGDINNWSIGWVDWNVVLDMQGGPNHVQNYCDSPLIADTENQVLYYQIMYYYLGHFSKFVPENSFRVASQLSNLPDANPDVYSTAFTTPDGNTVVVVMNQGNTTVTYQLQDQQFALIDIPQHSIQTLIYTSF